MKFVIMKGALPKCSYSGKHLNFEVPLPQFSFTDEFFSDPGMLEDTSGMNYSKAILPCLGFLLPDVVN